MTIARLYRENDEWKNTSTFGCDDLRLAAKATDQAHSRILTETQKDSNRSSRQSGT